MFQRLKALRVCATGRVVAAIRFCFYFLIRACSDQVIFLFFCKQLSLVLPRIRLDTDTIKSIIGS